MNSTDPIVSYLLALLGLRMPMLAGAAAHGMQAPGRAVGFSGTGLFQHARRQASGFGTGRGGPVIPSFMAGSAAQGRNINAGTNRRPGQPRAPKDVPTAIAGAGRRNVRFIPGGGNNARGAFAELSEDQSPNVPEYGTPTESISEIICEQPRYRMEMSGRRQNAPPDAPPRTTRVIQCQGRTVEHGRQDIALSFLGQKAVTRNITVWFFEAPENRVAAFGVSAVKSGGQYFQQGFHLAIYLSPQGFSQLLEGLQAPDAKLYARVDFSRFPGFLTSAQKGDPATCRTVKYLNGLDDVIDPTECPRDILAKLMRRDLIDGDLTETMFWLEQDLGRRPDMSRERDPAPTGGLTPVRSGHVPIAATDAPANSNGDTKDQERADRHATAVSAKAPGFAARSLKLLALGLVLALLWDTGHIAS